MTPGECFLVVCFVAASIGQVSSLLLGEICSTDSECVSDVENSECAFTVPCTERGHCRCRSGYGSPAGDGCNKILRSHGQPCDSTTYCTGINEECSRESRTCTCETWYLWNTVAQRCIEMEKAVFTEPCGPGIFADDCLVTEEDGGKCDGICMCIAGFTMNWYNLTCDPPIYGYTCLAEPLCVLDFEPATVSNDRATTVPTCQHFVCRCPLSHDHVYVNGYHICLQKVDNSTLLLGNGEPCEQFKDCESNFCYICPEETQGICYANPTELLLSSSQAQSRAQVLMIGTLVTATMAMIIHM